jgi:hypothetical protein
MMKRHVLANDRKPGGFVKGVFEDHDTDDGPDTGWVLRACILDTRSPECVYDSAGGRWVVTCELHDACVNLETLQIANWFAHRTGSFCPECAKYERDWLDEREDMEE